MFIYNDLHRVFFLNTNDTFSTINRFQINFEKICSFYRNALVEYMLDGTAIKEAVDNGKSIDGRDCDSIYPGCPLDRQSSMQVLTKLLPKN